MTFLFARTKTFQVTVSSLGETQEHQTKKRMGRDLPFVLTPYYSLASCWLEEE
jgi:hypothetical protein